MSVTIETVFTAIASSTVSAGIVGAIFTYYLNKKFDTNQRAKNVRKDLYSKIQEALSGFFETTNSPTRAWFLGELPKLYRQTQLWGSKNVVVQFNNFLSSIEVKNKRKPEEIEMAYSQLVIEMRKDLTGETIDQKEIRRYGVIN